MKDQIAETLKAIELCDLPTDFDKILGDCYDPIEGCFAVQETSILDYKEGFPDPSDKDYISGLLKLIIAFHNNYGGVIIFGVRNGDFKTVGVEGNFDIELYNSLIRELFGVNAELIRRDYFVEKPTRCRLTVLLIPKRANLAPVEAKRDYHQIKKGDLYVRDRHEALSASDRHLSQLFSSRKFFQSNDLPISVHVSLPPSPSTLPKYIGRFGLTKQLWSWFVFGRGPRIYLSGPGGSGKSTLAYEFAERVALMAQDIRLENGESIDYVMYLSAKETELNVKTATEQPFQMRQFKNSNEELGAILSNSGLQSEAEIIPLDYEQRLSALDDLFDNFNGLIVIDDIDALIRAGIDTGEEDLFLKASKGKKCTKIIYTLRNDASYAKNSSVPVPGLAREKELPDFVDACCQLFDVPPPDAAQEGAIATETSALPLLVETIIGLRKNSSSYEQAIRDFKEKGGDEARRYLYQREYDRLSFGGKSKQILATMMEYSGPLGFDAICTLAASTPEQTRLAINETANIFLKISTDELGASTYSLSPSSRPFIRNASLGLPYMSAIKRAVDHFRTSSSKSTPVEATLILRLENLLKNKKFDEASSSDQEVAPNDAVRVNPRFMAALGRAFAQCEKPDLTRARDLFSSASKFGHHDIFMMRAWYHVERLSGYRYEQAMEVCRSVLSWDKVSDRHRVEFLSKLGECLAIQARDRQGEGAELTSRLLCESAMSYLKALWVGKATDELDIGKTSEWLHRAASSYFNGFDGNISFLFRDLETFLKEGYGVERQSAEILFSPLNHRINAGKVQFLRKLQGTISVGIAGILKHIRSEKDIIRGGQLLAECINVQKRVEIRIMELSAR